MSWLVALFVHTAPHPPEGRWERALLRAEDEAPGGLPCEWEFESLVYEGRPVFMADVPEEGWCAVPSDSASYFDILAEDGPFLTIRTSTRVCEPDCRAEVRLATYDLRTGAPTSVAAWDPRRAKGRQRRLDRALARLGEGWLVDPSAFVIDRGHVRVQVERGDEHREIPIP